MDVGGAPRSVGVEDGNQIGRKVEDRLGPAIRLVVVGLSTLGDLGSRAWVHHQEPPAGMRVVAQRGQVAPQRRPATVRQLDAPVEAGGPLLAH